MDDKIKGTFDDAKGQVKEGVGRAIDDPQMETEGHWDQGEGETEKVVGEVKEGIDDTARKVEEGAEDLKQEVDKRI